MVRIDARYNFIVPGIHKSLDKLASTCGQMNEGETTIHESERESYSAWNTLNGEHLRAHFLETGVGETYTLEWLRYAH